MCVYNIRLVFSTRQTLYSGYCFNSSHLALTRAPQAFAKINLGSSLLSPGRRNQTPSCPCHCPSAERVDTAAAPRPCRSEILRS